MSHAQHTTKKQSTVPIKQLVIRGLIVIVLAVGVVGHVIPATRPLVLATSPFVLLIMSILMYSHIAKTSSKTLVLWSVITYLSTLLLEIIGVKTGSIFGSYAYGETLGFAVFGVPLLIGLNWVWVLLGALELSKGLLALCHKVIPTKTQLYILPVLASAIAVGFDFILEPVAIALNYWKWDSDTIPLQNYLAWFLISLFFSFFYMILRLYRKKAPLLAEYLLIQSVFFLLLRVFVA